MSKSSIEWTTETWNPVVGCSILTPGCIHCYAMGMAARIEAINAAMVAEGRPMASPQYAGTTRTVNGHAVWTGKLAMAGDNILLQPLKRRKPTTYFVNSMGDLFHEDCPDEWIDRVFAVMALSPQHTFQVLTKRAQRMHDYMHERWQPRSAQRINLGGGEVLDVPAEKQGHGRHEQVFQTCEYVFDRIPAMADTENDALWNEKGSLKCGEFAWPLPNVWLGVSTERIEATLKTGGY